MSGGSCGGCLLEINLINLNLPINEFVNVDHHAQAIDVHKDKARVHIVGDAAVGTSCRPRVYDDTSLMFVGSELMGVTSYKDIYIQLPLKHR